MRALTVISFLLAALLVAIHVGAVFTWSDPDNAGMMVAFFAGLPLAILVSVFSGVALAKTKSKRFWIPLGAGLFPVLGWPVVFVLEWMRIIP